MGIHFFNPAPLMPLVEVIPANGCSKENRDKAAQLLRSWEKTVVFAKDTPGFIVNRIARPFYGEALIILEEQTADAATIDWAMREIAGFRMGPFELMDLIGIDINYNVSEKVYAAFNQDPRYLPSAVQKRMLTEGKLGKKTGIGFYEYRDGAVKPAPNEDPELGRQIYERIIAMLINQALDAWDNKIASREDIETALVCGANYPKGLLEWGEELGFKTVLQKLNELRKKDNTERYRPSPLLEKLAAESC